MSGEYLGDCSGSEVLNIIFDSFSKAGASITITDFALTDILVYKIVANATTLRAGTGGYTLIDTDGVDIAGDVGIHGFTIDLKDNSDAGFYATQSEYYVVVSAITIDSETVRFVAGRWSIDNRQLLRPTVALNQLNVSAGGLADANLEAVNANSVPIDNFELGWNGVGIDGPKFPATQEQIGNIATSTGGQLPFEAYGDNTVAPVKGTPFVGVEASGSFEDTDAEDTVVHEITDTAGTTDIVYTFNVGGNRQGIEVIWVGFANSLNDDMNVFAYDFVAAGWDQRAVILGKNPSTNDPALAIVLLSKHTGPIGPDAGEVYIRFQGTGLTTASFNTDFIFVRGASIFESIGYQNSAVWINTNGGMAGTTPFVNGTADNPVDNIADALTLLDSIGLERIDVISESTIVLPVGGYQGRTMTGFNWTLDLAGRDISNSNIGGAIVTDTAVAPSGRPVFADCRMDSCTVPPCIMRNCVFPNTVTLNATGDYDVLDGRSVAAGPVVPTFDINSIATISLNMPGWVGGLTVNGIVATSDIVVVGQGGNVVANGDGGSGNMKVRGIYQSVADATTTGTTIEDEGSLNRQAIRDTSAAIERNTGFSGFPFDMFLADLNVPATAKTVTVERSLEGNAFVPATGSVVEVGDGAYAFNPSAADTDAAWGKWKFSAPDCADTKIGWASFT